MFPTAEIEKLVSQASKAQSLWQETPVRERLRNVKEFRFQIVEQKDRLLEAVQHDISKRPEETLGAELLPLAEACRFLEKRSHQI
ncbi:MAG: aldehyde dehydrogenase family protein, partial [Planctomycetia bacterium]